MSKFIRIFKVTQQLFADEKAARQASQIIEGIMVARSLRLTDLPATMTYPDGEILTYQYLPQRLLDKVYSNRKPVGTTGTYYLVQDTLYDAAGRVDRRDLGATSTTANPVLVSDYTYNPWTVDGGRMSDLQPASTPTRTRSWTCAMTTTK